jgi:phenylpyruvate tautomerase PptA (4-oxalocrotonate tautomerase family)
MPITVTAPRGVLTPQGERDILPRLTDALLLANEASGSRFFRWITGGSVHLLDPEAIFGGGANRPLVMVEVKLPDIGLADEASRATFIAAATDVVAELAVAGHDRDDIWVNILNAPSGAWGIGGRAFTGADLVAAAERDAAAAP